jgi:lipoyl(octanoyl) transferase
MIPVRRAITWAFHGRLGYTEATAMQQTAGAALRRGEASERLILLEHPHVYTLGRNASGSDVLAPAEWLRATGVEVAETNRGGQVTYHGPGQLVGYPIVNLDPDRRDIRRYVRDLQETLIRTLGDYGIVADRREGPENIGVWVGDEKIASIGVHIARWITSHGFALNVTTDLSYFRGIVACGLPAVRMASIESLTGRRPGLAEVAAAYARRFAEVFDRELVAAEAATASA